MILLLGKLIAAGFAFLILIIACFAIVTLEDNFLNGNLGRKDKKTNSKLEREKND